MEHEPSDVDGDVDAGAITGEVFVDGIVQNLEHAMVQAALVRGPDVHAGALADTGETLQFVDLGSIINTVVSGVSFVGHKGGKFREKVNRKSSLRGGIPQAIPDIFAG